MVFSSMMISFHDIEPLYDGMRLPNWPKQVTKVLSFREKLQQEVDWWLQGALPL